MCVLCDLAIDQQREQWTVMTTLLNIEQDTESREPAQNGCPCPICQAPRPETEIDPLASRIRSGDETPLRTAARLMAHR